ncbi:MAG: 2,3,4,5-tetrahydropyridine-2,6-dicarboxylate N-succinyltransferase, partial [Candidatus Pacebacteria bacterium]|nr:2,3,4,5-tetrahydropyridine-2,6-dicarboxylate N-succinyltransferase [Candidatus Paceibacterota bacterium]
MEEIIEKIIDEEDLRKPEVLHLLGGIIEEMHLGKIRLAEKQGDLWKVNKWVIDSINYYFLAKKIIGNSAFGFDKENMQFKIDWLKMRGVRALEGSLVRSGAYIAPGVVLMPSFVSIGAYVDEGSMIDTWATIGSGAQI